MTQPITYAARTARFDLPLLFAGQAQKEFTVNDALTRVSALLHPAIEGESAVPPANPAEGETWLIADPASGEWAGQEQALACWVDQGWHFIDPHIGFRCYDKSAGISLFFNGVWGRPQGPAPITGGTTQDTQARAAIAELIAVLEQSGIV